MRLRGRHSLHIRLQGHVGSVTTLLKLLIGGLGVERTETANGEGNAEPSSGSEHSVGDQTGHDEKYEGEYDGGCDGGDVFPEVVSS